MRCSCGSRPRSPTRRKPRRPPAARLVQPHPRRRRLHDALAHVRHLEAVRPRVHDARADPLAGRPVGAVDGRAADDTGTAYTAGLPVPVVLSRPRRRASSRPHWRSLDGVAGDDDRLGPERGELYFRDAASGSATIVAAAAGKTAATQAVTIAAPPASHRLRSHRPRREARERRSSGPDLSIQASAAPAAPAIGTTLTYVLTVRNFGAPASRAFVAVQLPSQVDYTASQSDRGPGCTGTTALTSISTSCPEISSRPCWCRPSFANRAR